MPAIWPETLPGIALRAGSRYEPISNATPIPVEAGELLTRSRFTGDMARFTVALNLTSTQTQQLLSFWRYDLKTGALTFLWEDPITGNAVEMLFDRAPVFDPLGGNAWRATFTLVSKPS